MIICNSNDFVVIRAQKTAGLSLEMYILESGLVNTDIDTYTLEGGFANWEEFKAYSEVNNLKYSELPEELFGDGVFEAQTSFSELVSQNKIRPYMPCIGGIRNPLEWVASMFYHAKVRAKVIKEQNFKRGGYFLDSDILYEQSIAEPNDAWDVFFVKLWENKHVQENLKAQTSYYPDHAELFNIENMHEHVSKFIADKGGIVPTQIIRMRESDNDPTYFLKNLSEDRKQRTLDLYEKDFELWEKAYAVYN